MPEGDFEEIFGPFGGEETEDPGLFSDDVFDDNLDLTEDKDLEDLPI